MSDILSVTHGIIVHQVNMQGVMGRGLARAIAIKWPSVQDSYIRAVNHGEFSLGSTQFVPVQSADPDKQLFVCNLVGQDRYGVDRQHTDYHAFDLGLRGVASFSIGMGLPVHIPYGIGCGLGGGDWDIVEYLIMQRLPHAVIHPLHGDDYTTFDKYTMRTPLEMAEE